MSLSSLGRGDPNTTRGRGLVWEPAPGSRLVTDAGDQLAGVVVFAKRYAFNS